MKTFQARRGTYIIRKSIPETNQVEVEYIEGEWKGRIILMDAALHYRMLDNIQLEGRIAEKAHKRQIDDKLDLWYEKYPGLYKTYWKDGMKGEDLLGTLESTYPINAENVEEDYSEFLGMVDTGEL